MKCIAAAAAVCVLLTGTGSGLSQADYLENGRGATKVYSVTLGYDTHATEFYAFAMGDRAAALAALCRPNDAPMFSIGGSRGGGEDMMNVGMSFKVGHRSEYVTYSKAALTSVISQQQKRLDAQMEEIPQRLSKL